MPVFLIKLVDWALSGAEVSGVPNLYRLSSCSNLARGIVTRP